VENCPITSIFLITEADEASAYMANDITVVDITFERFTGIAFSKTLDSLPLTTAVLTTQPCYSEVTEDSRPTTIKHP